MREHPPIEFIPAPELAAVIREGAHAARELRNEIDAQREASRRVSDANESE